MKPSILDQETNLLKLYMYHVGESEVPEEYHLWCCLSMIASCAANRVWLEKFRGRPLAPNLYVFLLGPSAVGKGEAIDTAVRFVKNNPRVGLYAGEATAQYLLRRMGRPRRTEEGKLVLENSKLFIVTPELAMSLGKGEIADAFIKHMTEMYTGRDYPMRKGTVTQGDEIVLKDYCMNWLAGTNREWLLQCMPRDAIAGGPFGRIATVSAKYDLDRRFYRPKYPHDYEAVVDYMQERIDTLSHVEGQFSMSAEARETEEHWYMNRPSPTEEALIPVWKREHDLLLKLAMVLSLTDNIDLVIRKPHVVQAQRLCAEVFKAMPDLLEFASTTIETAGLQMVMEYMRQMKKVLHSTLVRYTSSHGVSGSRLREILDTLIQSRRMQKIDDPRYGRAYVWTERRRIPTGVDKQP